MHEMLTRTFSTEPLPWRVVRRLETLGPQPWSEFLHELLAEVLFSEFVDIGSDITNAISITYDPALTDYAVSPPVVRPATGRACLATRVLNMDGSFSSRRLWYPLFTATDAHTPKSPLEKVSLGEHVLPCLDTDFNSFVGVENCKQT